MLRGFMPASAWRPNSSSGKQQDASAEIVDKLLRSHWDSYFMGFISFLKDK